MQTKWGSRMADRWRTPWLDWLLFAPLALFLTCAIAGGFTGVALVCWVAFPAEPMECGTGPAAVLAVLGPVGLVGGLVAGGMAGGCVAEFAADRIWRWRGYPDG